MKKILCVLLCILLFGGCGFKKSKDVEKEPLSISGFRCTLRTTLNDIEITADAEYLVSGTIQMEITSPQTVSGMKINCNNGEYAVLYKNLELIVDGEKLPFRMICKSLEECINNAQGKIAQKDEKSESYFYSYNAQGHTCKLYVNPETKAFQKIVVDGIDTLYFENFIYVYGTN